MEVVSTSAALGISRPPRVEHLSPLSLHSAWRKTTNDTRGLTAVSPAPQSPVFPSPEEGKAHLPGSGGGGVRTAWNGSRQRMNMIWKDGKTPQPLFRGSLKD